jgi:NAD(P)-dependent dehydrogenase (short-subunit alcohol dehydrogenase family)
MASPVLIFGGSGGVGFALARLLTRRGQAVHLAARDGGRLAACSHELGGSPWTSVDVIDTAAVAQVVAAAGRDGLAGLAYCVGSIVLKPLKRTTEGDFLEAFCLNVLGAAVAVQAGESWLRRANGAVVLFSTVAAGTGFPNHAVIATAKAAIEGLTRSLAAELAPDVRVNCIAPSLTRTPLAAPLTGNEAMSRSLAALHPIPRLGEADDLAAAAAFLLSSESSWITGQVLAVDGGRSTLRTKG